MIFHWLTTAETHATLILTALANLAYLRYMHRSLRSQINGSQPPPEPPPS